MLPSLRGFQTLDSVDIVAAVDWMYLSQDFLLKCRMLDDVMLLGVERTDMRL